MTITTQPVPARATAANDTDRSSRPPNVDGRDSKDELSPASDVEENDASTLDEQVLSGINGVDTDEPMPGRGEEEGGSNPNPAREEGREPRPRESDMDADAAEDDADAGEMEPDGTGAERP